MAEHADALVAGDPTRIEVAARDLSAMGARLAAAEAYAHAARVHARDGAAIAARRSATLSLLLERRCAGAATPARGGRPVAISDREADVAVLALLELGSREIAGQLYLSRRTVDNLSARSTGDWGCTDGMSSGSCSRRSARPIRDDGRIRVPPPIATAPAPAHGVTIQPDLVSAAQRAPVPHRAGPCRHDLRYRWDEPTVTPVWARSTADPSLPSSAKGLERLPGRVRGLMR